MESEPLLGGATSLVKGDGSAGGSYELVDEVLEALGSRGRTTGPGPSKGSEVGPRWKEEQLVWMMALLWLADSAEVTLLSFLYECAGAAFDLSRSGAASVVSAVFAGECVGALLSGPLGDAYGRAAVSKAAAGVVSIFGLASAFATNYGSFVACRCIVGLGLGTFCVPLDLVAELVPAEVRGVRATQVMLGWAAGAVFVASMAWVILPVYSWRLLVVVSALPLCCVFVAMIALLEESPKYLVATGQHALAAEVLTRLAQGHPDEAALAPRVQAIAKYQVNDTTQDRDDQSSSTRDDPSSTQSALVALTKFAQLGATHDLRHLTARAWLLWFSWAFAYFGASILAAKFFADASDVDLQCRFNYPIIAAVFSSELLGTLACLPVVDTLGRRHTQLAAFLAASMGLAPLALGLHDNIPLVFLALFITLAGLTGGTNVAFIHLPELYATNVRATAHGAAYTISRFGAIAASFSVDSFFSDQQAAAALLAATTLAALVVFSLQETKARHI